MSLTTQPLANSILVSGDGQKYHKRLVLLSLLENTLKNVCFSKAIPSTQIYTLNERLRESKHKLDVMTVCLKMRDPETKKKKLYSVHHSSVLYEEFAEYDDACKCESCDYHLVDVKDWCKDQLMDKYPDILQVGKEYDDDDPEGIKEKNELFLKTKHEMIDIEKSLNFFKKIIQPFESKRDILCSQILHNCKIVDWKSSVNRNFLAFKKQRLLEQLDLLDRLESKPIRKIQKIS